MDFPIYLLDLITCERRYILIGNPEWNEVISETVSYFSKKVLAQLPSFVCSKISFSKFFLSRFCMEKSPTARQKSKILGTKKN